MKQWLALSVLMLIPTISPATTTTALTLDEYQQVKTDLSACMQGIGQQGIGLRFSPSVATPTLQRLLVVAGGKDNPNGDKTTLLLKDTAGALLQTLPVQTDLGAPAFLPCSVRVEDVNFDGYQDIAVVTGFGAKWHRANYWLYESASGRYRSSPLTHALGQLTPSAIVFNPQDKTISTRYIVINEGVAREVFQVEGDSLVLMEEETWYIDASQDGKTTATLRKRHKGEMQVVEVKSVD